MSGSSGTCLHALLIPNEWRAWGIKRGGVFQDRGDAGAGYSLLGMTNLRRPGAYEIASAMVMLPRAYRPGDEAEALAAFRDPLETEIRQVSWDGVFTRSASTAP